ncbi:MAG: LbtU family siderophore porin [Legionellales bacterium]
MKFKKIILALACLSSPLYAEQDQQLQQDIQRLQKQTRVLQAQLDKLQQQVVAQKKNPSRHKIEPINNTNKPEHHLALVKKTKKQAQKKYHSSEVVVHAPDDPSESIHYYPTALIADHRVVTYIAGTPVVTSPYLGARPAFDGSDYIVNISSINRDIRLMEQRRRLYQAYQSIGYPVPQVPILALSGKTEPIAVFNKPYSSRTSADLTLGSSEFDLAAALNQNVEAYIAIAYDASPPEVGPRIDNSAFNLNMGFVNIGNLDKTPLYFTAGQLYVPFGRYSSSMVSAPITLNLARTKTRPFILGYKSQEVTGPFAAIYGYRSDTNLGGAAVGGANLGYVFSYQENTGEIGASFISSLDDSAGMQHTGSPRGTTFGGFGSPNNGNEMVRKTPALDVHATLGYERFNFAVEWVGALESFRTQDLSFNGQGARPEAAQAEVDMTFRAFDRPSSIGFSYQWSKDALALNLPQQRFSGVFNISIWKDTVESIEYKHDLDYGTNQFANGAAPTGLVNATTIGTGRSADTVSVQIGVFF